MAELLGLLLDRAARFSAMQIGQRSGGMFIFGGTASPTPSRPRQAEAATVLPLRGGPHLDRGFRP